MINFIRTSRKAVNINEEMSTPVAPPSTKISCISHNTSVKGVQGLGYKYLDLKNIINKNLAKIITAGITFCCFLAHFHSHLTLTCSCELLLFWPFS